MGLEPERACNLQHINPKAAPPNRFVAVAMELAMMAAAQRNSELVTHFAGQCASLRKAQMMRIRRKSPHIRQGRVATNLT
jgi:hypothetical protein